MSGYLRLLRGKRPAIKHVNQINRWFASTLHCRSSLRYPTKLRGFVPNISVRTASTEVQTDTIPTPSKRGKLRDDLSQMYQIGNVYDGWICDNITNIESYETIAYEFTHLNTKARYMHLDTCDTNNSFAIAFKTIPKDSSGIAHILEHTTLCGSNSYPVRDPFFHMLKRSLNTFMNAMTSSDWTCYPFSTQNETDFSNLLKVYTDSVFFPILNEYDFMQEGHRIEFEDMNDKNSKLKYKGVVYNEMKGYMSDSDDILGFNIQKELFCDTIYKYNFGGDPKYIPSLTHGKLIEFHKKYYHPSNSLFYSYGDLKPKLSELNELVLNQFSYIDADEVIETQERYNHERFVEVSGPTDPMITDENKQTKIAVSWLCNEVNDFKETFSLMVLDQLLLSGPNSSFYDSLIRPNISSGYTSNTGYNMATIQGSFTIGLNNVKTGDAQDIRRRINSTLDSIMKNGFKRERVEGVLHQFEIDQKHRSGTFGLNLLFRMLSLVTHKVYEPSPLIVLNIDDLILDIKKKVLGTDDEAPTDPKHFENLVKKYLIDNQHKVEITVKPDKEYMNKLDIEENKSLGLLEATLSDQSKDYIVQKSNELLEHQERELDIEVLPTLKIEDIPIEAPEPVKVNVDTWTYDVYDEAKKQELGLNTDVIQAKDITNDISYYRMLYDLKPLFKTNDSIANIENDAFHVIMPLFAMCFANMGAADMGYEQLSEIIDLKTGGINANLHTLTPLYLNETNQYGNDKLNYYLEVSGHCLNRNLNEMIYIMQDVCLHPKYNFIDRLETLLKDKTKDDLQSLISEGHAYGISYSMSKFGNILPATLINEKLNGLSQIKFEYELLKSFHTQRYQTIKELIELFDDISKQLFQQSTPIRTSFVSDDKGYNMYPNINDELLSPFAPIDYKVSSNGVLNRDRQKNSILHNAFIAALKEDQMIKPNKNSNVNVEYNPMKTYFAVPTQVNYVTGIIPTVSYTHEDCGALRVASKLLSLNYLHNEIRERGGAYGGGCTQNKNLFAFFSYRDPNTIETIDTFKQSIDWILDDNNVTQKDINECLLNLFGGIDSPKSCFEKYDQEFLQNMNEDIRQKHRHELLSVNKTKLRDVVEKYLYNAINDNNDDKIAYTIVGKKDLDQKEMRKLVDNQFKVVKIQ